MTSGEYIPDPANGINFPQDLDGFEFEDALYLQRANESEDLLDQATVERLYTRSGDFEIGTPLHGHVLEALSTTDPDEASYRLFSAGTEIAATTLERHKTVRARAMAYLQACHEIDRIKVGYSGYEGDHVPMNTIMHYVRLSITQELQPSEKTSRTAWVVHNHIEQLFGKYPPVGWFMPKIFLFMQDIQRRHTLRATLDEVQVDRQVSAEQQMPTGEVEAAAKELMAETMQYRKYGIKPAYIPASIGGAWVYYEAYSFDPTIREKRNRDKQIVPMVASIVHTTETDFRNLQVGKPQDTRYGTGIVRQVKGAIMPDFNLHLGIDGELYIDHFGWRRLKDEIGADSPLLGSLTAELVSNFHDLTVPVDLIRRQGLTNITQKPQAGSGKRAFSPILDMLIPRIKAHRERPAVTVPDTEMTRTVREHDVIWHVRTLPDGWHASPEAIENARLHNVPLAPNETFVKEHRRGQQNQVMGHKAIRRLINKTMES